MSGNGVDLASIYQLLSQVAQAVTRHERKLDDIERRVGDLDHKLGSLRQAVTEYHASVLGHGILITELDVRLRRVEQHLSLNP